MKYPELAKVSFVIPQPPEKPALPKLVPAPNLPLPNTAAEEAAIIELRDFQAFKTQLLSAKLEKIRIERAKKEAFSKILVPQAAASDLTKSIQKRPDLSEFDTIGTSSNDINTINNDFHLLKEIMGGVENVKVTSNTSTNSLPPPTDIKKLGSMQSSLASSPQSFHGVWHRTNPGGPPSISSSPHSSVISLGSPSKQQSPRREMDTPPPVVRNISPALKQKIQTNVGPSNEKFDSLVQMGFKSNNVAKALDVFTDEQEILDFLVLLQDLNEEYVAMIITIEDRKMLEKRISEFKDLVEMGFVNTKVAQVLVSTGLDKSQALEKLLSQ